MPTAQEYEKRLIEMQDVLSKQEFQKVTDRYTADMAKYNIEKQINAYAEYIHETSEKKTVDRFKEIISQGNVSLSEIPVIFFNLQHGIKITRECLNKAIENLPTKYDAFFEKMKQQNKEQKTDTLVNINKGLRIFVYNIEYLTKMSKIQLIIDDNWGKQLYSDFCNIIDKMIEQQKSISVQNQDYILSSSNEMIKKLETILPISNSFAQDKKQVLINRANFDKPVVTGEEKRFSI